MMIHLIILTTIVIAALWTIMTRSLLRAAIGLAAVSAALSVMMFRLSAPLAAVFELSVCTGLISVLFVSAISLTRSMTMDEVLQHAKERMRRFWFLPVLAVLVGIGVSFIHSTAAVRLPAPETVHDVRIVLWHLRRLDIIGQVIILLAGAFGVMILFKETK
ncbi:MAG: NADH-quinone oxidoreductase subunit J [Candidatus Omnitrophota bacterium]